MTFNAKMAVSDLQRNPSKLCLNKYELDIHVFVFQRCFFILGSLQKLVALFLLTRNNGDIIKITTFFESDKRRYLPEF